MKKKTVLDWVQEFPEPYRGMALANLQYPDAPASNRLFALTRGFSWCDSIQGSNFWGAVAKYLESKGNFPVFPDVSHLIEKQEP